MDQVVSVFVSVSDVAVCLITERGKMQQDLGKVDQVVSVFASVSIVSVCLLTERDKLQQDFAKMDEVVSVFVSVSNVSVCLLTERDKLQQDLAKMDQFEEKLREEQVILKQKVAEMEKELAVYSDLDKLRTDAEEKKRVTPIVSFVTRDRHCTGARKLALWCHCHTRG